MGKELRRAVCVILGMLVIVIGSLIGGGSCERREASASAACNGSIAECYEESEFFMDSDVNRRILPGTPIKYKPLVPNLPALVKPKPGRPYTGRGCKKAYGCRG